MQTVISDKDLHLNMSSSSPPLDTPSFSPNTPSNENPHFKQTQPQDAKVHSARGTIKSESDSIGDLDLNEPVSTLLRLGTQRAHVKAEHSAGAAALVQGGLGLEEYIRWLAVLWRIYDALELGLAENSSNPVLAPTYDPSLLARAPALSEDISYLLTLLPESSSKSTSNSFDITSNSKSLPPFPIPPFLEGIFTSPPEPLSNYLNHIKSLSSNSDSSSRLLAHSYVRYLGDLSGGQFIGNKVKKSYNLNNSDERGTRFYYFEFSNSTINGNDNDVESKFDAKKRLTQVKDWFRKGMDEGVGEDKVLKADLVEEANVAFSLNTDLFSVIRLHPSSPSTSSTSPAHSGKIGTQTKSQAETDKSITDKLNSIIWFLVAAAFGVALNIYVQPIVRGWMDEKIDKYSQK